MHILWQVHSCVQNHRSPQINPNRDVALTRPGWEALEPFEIPEGGIQFMPYLPAEWKRTDV